MTREPVPDVARDIRPGARVAITMKGLFGDSLHAHVERTWEPSGDLYRLITDRGTVWRNPDGTMWWWGRDELPTSTVSSVFSLEAPR